MSEAIDIGAAIEAAVAEDGGAEAAPTAPSGEGSAPATPQPTGYTWDSLKATLPEDLQQSPYLQNYDSLEGLAKDFHNAQRLIGGEKIARPKPDAPQEDWDRFYNTLGRPESPDGYQVELDIPEDVPWDGELQEAMLAEFHTAGLTQQQAEHVMKAFAAKQVETLAQRDQIMEQHAEQTQQALRQEWGPSFDQNIELAKRSARAIFGDAMDEIVNTEFGGTVFGNHPVVIKALSDLGARMSEGSFTAGQGGQGSFAMSQEQARQQIAELEKSDAFREAFLNEGHQEHFAVKRKHEALYAVAYPDES